MSTIFATKDDPPPNLHKHIFGPRNEIVSERKTKLFFKAPHNSKRLFGVFQRDGLSAKGNINPSNKMNQTEFEHPRNPQVTWTMQAYLMAYETISSGKFCVPFYPITIQLHESQKNMKFPPYTDLFVTG